MNKKTIFLSCLLIFTFIFSGCNIKFLNKKTNTDLDVDTKNSSALHNSVKEDESLTKIVLEEEVPAEEIENKSEVNQEKDSDNDGLSDEDEIKYGTDINNPDTDNDGYKDGDEVKDGYNPLGVGKLIEDFFETSCDAFPDKLSLCSKYKCNFIHPLTKETMEREIVGVIEKKCRYIEQMPNGGKMECNYTESVRKVAAQYYEIALAAESTEVSMEANLVSGEKKTIYKIDGKEVENPLETFLTDGTCVISGY